MELSKQEMESFLPFPVIRSKNFFNKSIANWSKDFKIDFRNREMELSKQEMELFIPFPVIRLSNGVISSLSSHQVGGEEGVVETFLRFQSYSFWNCVAHAKLIKLWHFYFHVIFG